MFKKIFKSKSLFLLIIVCSSLIFKAEGCNNGNKKSTLKLVDWRYMTLDGVTVSGQPVNGQSVTMFGVTGTLTNGSVTVEYSGTATTGDVTVGGPDDDNNVMIKKTIKTIPKGQLEAGLTWHNVMPSIYPVDYFSPIFFFRTTTWNPNISARELWIYDDGNLPKCHDPNGNEIPIDQFIQTNMQVYWSEQFKSVKYVDRAYTVQEIEAMAKDPINPVYISYVQRGTNNATSDGWDSNGKIIWTHTDVRLDNYKQGGNTDKFNYHELIFRILGFGSPSDSYKDEYPSILYPFPNDMANSPTIHDRRFCQMLRQWGAGVSAPDTSYYE